MKVKRGIAICHYNRTQYLKEIVEAVQKTAPAETRVVICDDGSDQHALNMDIARIAQECGVLLIQGANLGVAANKNRALWALQDCHYICILEDDLKPTHKGWFEAYEGAAKISGIHHFCRVQDKEVSETIKSFSAFMGQNDSHPIYGRSPRGDLTFLTSNVLHTVGAFNPTFRGAGYAHGEWSNRVARAGLINHPLKWVDIRKARDSFVQVGDTEGGRWNVDEKEIRKQLQRNKVVLRQLEKEDYTYHELVLE
jgi:glycosyltransferase involved in cell wall biosynthesis